jgi:hypothetical protein
MVIKKVQYPYLHTTNTFMDVKVDTYRKDKERKDMEGGFDFLAT